MAAKKYANALLEVMKRENMLKPLRGEMRDIRELVKDKQVCDYLADGSVKRKDKMEAFLSCHPITKGFINVISDEKKEREIYDISREYINLLNKQLGEEDVEVTSGIALSDGEKKKLEDALGGRLGKKLNVFYTVNKDIIGGMYIKYGNSVLDGSVRGELNEILIQMTE